MPRDTDCMPEDYWDQLPDGGSEDLPDTILSDITADASEYGFDVLAVDVADRTDSELYCLVIRRKVSDSGDLIMSERYYRYDLDEREGSFTGNGIERRVGGSMIAALRVLYASLGNGDAVPESPMLLDSTGDGLQHEAPELTDPELLIEDDSDEEDDLDAEEETPVDPAVAADEPDRKSWVRCRRCGEELPEEDAVHYGQGDLGDFWIHDSAADCEDQEGGA